MTTKFISDLGPKSARIAPRPFLVKSLQIAHAPQRLWQYEHFTRVEFQQIHGKNPCIIMRYCPVKKHHCFPAYIWLEIKSPAQPQHYWDNQMVKSRYLSPPSLALPRPHGSQGCKWLVHLRNELGPKGPNFFLEEWPSWEGRENQAFPVSCYPWKYCIPIHLNNHSKNLNSSSYQD